VFVSVLLFFFSLRKLPNYFDQYRDYYQIHSMRFLKKSVCVRVYVLFFGHWLHGAKKAHTSAYVRIVRKAIQHTSSLRSAEVC
jgi:hypothetical protein